MARYEFSTNISNSMPMSSARQTINDVINGALAKPMDATTANTFYNISGNTYTSTAGQLVGVLPNKVTFAADANYIQSILPNPLTVSNLTVTGNTSLGDGTGNDIVTISATVVGLNCNANFSGGTVTATHFVGGDFNGTTVHATTGEFDNLKVGGKIYRPFIISDTAPTESGVQNQLWINTANNIVPIVMYCDVDASDTTTTISAGNWHPLGAVFG